MNSQPAQRAMTTMASPMIVPKDEPFSTKFAFAVVVLIIGLACFVALVAVASVVMPRTAERCRAVVARWPIQALVAGLLVYAVGGGVAYYLLSLGYVPRLLRVEIVPGLLAAGLGVVLGLLVLTLAGATGTVRVFGERLTARPGESVTPLREIAVGSLVVALGSWFPLVGWCLVMPGVLLLSCGAPIIGWLRRGQIQPAKR